MSAIEFLNDASYCMYKINEHNRRTKEHLAQLKNGRRK